MIDTSYEDAHGDVRMIAPEVIEQLSRWVADEDGNGGGNGGGNGDDHGDRRVGPLVVRPGAAVGPGAVTLEQGGSVEVRDVLPADVPLGYHRFTDTSGERALIVAPPRCHLPDDVRMWGWAAQLYACHSANSWGIGDLGDLRRLASWAAGSGAGFVMVNPLQASAPGAPQEPSPYSPTSRRFRNPIYLDVPAVARRFGGLDATALDSAAADARGRQPSRRIDRDRVITAKMRALEQIWRSAEGIVAPVVEAADASMEEYATWCVLAERFGDDWTVWPERYRSPGSPDVRRVAVAERDRVRFHCWLQQLLAEQFDEAAATLSIMQDLPIGFAPTGADAWSWQDLLATGVHVGAPPDEFNTSGQDWCLSPFIPSRLRAADYVPFRDSIRATVAMHGALRIDHVMGLFRLWWIPEGNRAADGAYVRTHAEDLLAIVALESVRNRAIVVGEDLGTVQEAARSALAGHDVLSYRLLWFEQDEPARWPTRAMAAVTTHDLPTVAGLWDGSDLEEQRREGLAPNAEGQEAIRRRLQDTAGLDPSCEPTVAVEAAYRQLADAPSMLLCATLEDACAEPRRPNMPGANQRDNWSLASSRSLEELFEDPLPATIARLLGRHRAGERHRARQD